MKGWRNTHNKCASKHAISQVWFAGYFYCIQSTNYNGTYYSWKLDDWFTSSPPKLNDRTDGFTWRIWCLSIYRTYMITATNSLKSSSVLYSLYKMKDRKVLASFFLGTYNAAVVILFSYNVSVYLQVLLTGFRSLPPLFADTPNAVHELTIASNILPSNQLHCPPKKTFMHLYSYRHFILIIEAVSVSKS